MEDEYKDISPLYMQRLKGKVENALWNLFEESKYRQVEEYIRRWHDDDGHFLACIPLTAGARTVPPAYSRKMAISTSAAHWREYQTAS